jgi:non-homologous end joining protein Ku
VPAPRSQWKGFLKLSLVSCPIALYPAITDAHRVKFRQVNKRTGNRLRHQLVDTVTGEAVERYDKGRGYEIGADQFLPVEEHEIEAARAAATVAPPPEQERRSEPKPVARRMLPARDMDEVEVEEEMPVPPPPPPRLENDHTIEIERFVPRSQIDPVYFDKAYYIVPREPVGQEAFAVVRNAMSEEGMVALGHVTL